MKRIQQILLAILLVQAIISVIVYWPSEASTITGELLLGNFTADEVEFISIRDIDGNYLELSKSGSDWVLPVVGNFPANSEKVEQIIDKILAIKSNRLVTRTESSHQRLQVAEDDYSRMVVIGNDGGEENTIFIGSSTGAQATHIRKDGQDEVFLTGEISAWEAATNSSSWIDTVYLTISSEEIMDAVLENGYGIMEFERDETDRWVMKGLFDEEELDLSQLTSLLSKLTSLRMIEPLGIQDKVEYGFAEPLARLTLTIHDEELGVDEEITLLVGALTPEGDGYYVYSSASPYYVTISNFSIEDFVNFTKGDFLKKVPTPTPET
jgi:hypothetical protein